MSRDFTKIKAWQHADDLCVEIYQSTGRFPKEERYGLTSQIRRAAVSVPANIAEGAARQTKKDYLHFLYVANASLAEVRYHLHLSQRLNFLTSDQYGKLNASQVEAASTLRGLIKAVEKETKVVSRLLAFFISTISLYSASHLAGLS
jgi:four helix bundle protein